MIDILVLPSVSPAGLSPKAYGGWWGWEWGVRRPNRTRHVLVSVTTRTLEKTDLGTQVARS